MLRRFTLTTLLLSSLPYAFVGCTSGGPGSDVGSSIDSEDGLPNAQAGLAEMADLFKYFAGESIKPPKKAAYFAKYDTGFPIAGTLLANGKIIYAGGMPDKTGPAKVLGYESGADTAGGWVLLTTGEIKQVTSEEFGTLSTSNK